MACLCYASHMTNTANVPADRVVGSAFGLAYGDAIGDPTEFRKYDEIVRAGGAQVPARLRVTDDTQMSLAVWHALNAWDPASGLDGLLPELAAEFLAWLHDADNNRAPGNTCLSSLHQLERVGLERWTSATSQVSAGCGSVMRAPWVGLHPKVADDMVTPVAMLQAVLTHGPAENAYAAAAVAELTRALARDEVRPGGAAEWLFTWAVAARGRGYDEAALSNLHALTARSDGPKVIGMSADEYVVEGCTQVLMLAADAGNLADALAADPWGFDPCSIAGEGWRAREAVAVAVGILDGFALMTDHSLGAVASEMLLRAAETNGDSDSIGAILGGLAGAAFGDVWPSGWKFRLESRYARELAGVTG